ncbi:MarR family transcriptional regulator [Herbiconiux sp. 11R-BC]|uniref:MarR family winged helix-turn-helix transcriptional regulator n=1 Tax=Herbiconiux sp. 11R-BC TaxID=3111637 RepID=UPI003C0D0780
MTESATDGATDARSETASEALRDNPIGSTAAAGGARVAPSPLDSMLCFALYSASNAVAQAHRAALAPWNLTYTQYVALVELAVSPSGLAVSELGRRMSLDSGTLSPLLRRLEQRGLVRRERRSSDERVVIASATEAGRATVDELAESIRCLNAGYGLESMADAGSLVAALHRIASGMHEVTAAATAGELLAGAEPRRSARAATTTATAGAPAPASASATPGTAAAPAAAGAPAPASPAVPASVAPESDALDSGAAGHASDTAAPASGATDSGTAAPARGASAAAGAVPASGPGAPPAHP